MPQQVNYYQQLILNLQNCSHQEANARQKEKISFIYLFQGDLHHVIIILAFVGSNSITLVAAEK
jgi:hypothetical protein